MRAVITERIVFCQSVRIRNAAGGCKIGDNRRPMLQIGGRFDDDIGAGRRGKLQAEATGCHFQSGRNDIDYIGNGYWQDGERGIAAGYRPAAVGNQDAINSGICGRDIFYCQNV